MSQLEHSIRQYKETLVEFLSNGNYQITQELHLEIKAILQALDSLKLDNMFLNKSHELRNKYDLNSLNQRNAELENLITQGQSMTYELKNELDKRHLASLQENQIRKIHYVAKERLRAFLQAIHPFSQNAYTRLDRYAADLGIRDRLSDIRKELSPCSKQDNFETWAQWTDKTRPEPAKFETPDWREATYGLRHNQENRSNHRLSTTNRNNMGLYFTHENRLNNHEEATQRPATHHSNQTQRISTNTTQFVNNQILNESNDWRKHAKEAGINLDFPGQTEFQHRYTKPVIHEYRNFIVNPQPDFYKMGRPLTSAPYYPKVSEYQSRYKYPDSNAIDKFPWIKKF